MVLFNYSTRELTAKIVYYGPGLCGKTTNLQYIFDNLPGSVKGKMLSLATKTDRTLFFDFLPLDLGEIRGMKTRIQLYTVPGQVFYNETRRLVLKGADGVVFVADSQRAMLEANVDSYKNLEENLRVHSMKLSDMPLVVQYNKRDLPNLAGVEDLNATVNRYNSPFYESVATTGIGVQDTLKAITKLVLLHLTRRYETKKPMADSVAGSPASVASFPAPGGAATGAPAGRSTAFMGGGKPVSAAKHVPEAMRPAAAATAYDEGVDVEAEESEEDIIELTDEYDEPEMAAASTMVEEEEVPIELEDEIEDEAPTMRMQRPSMSLTGAEPGSRPSAAPPARPMAPPPPASRTGVTNGGGASRTAGRRGTGAAVEDVELTLSESEIEAPAVRLRLGEQHLSIPVEMEVDGQVRRFTLSIRLDLRESEPGT
jgi:signal recognition particle receptor subunit beta